MPEFRITFLSGGGNSEIGRLVKGRVKLVSLASSLAAVTSERQGAAGPSARSRRLDRAREAQHSSGFPSPARDPPGRWVGPRCQAARWTRLGSDPAQIPGSIPSVPRRVLRLVARDAVWVHGAAAPDTHGRRLRMARELDQSVHACAECFLVRHRCVIVLSGAGGDHMF